MHIDTQTHRFTYGQTHRPTGPKDTKTDRQTHNYLQTKVQTQRRPTDGTRKLI